MAEIQLKGIRKSFGDVSVVRGIDLTIADGEFFTFVGPSGCGKSTLLNIIAGLEAADAGNILFDGADVTGLPPRERDVAMVFQNYALYPHMTVAENIAFPLRMRKMSGETVAGEVERMVALLGLDGLARRKPAQLSGGQRQRVALARALVRKPKVFLLDEPLSNLDAQLRVTMRAEIKKLQRDLKITTIFVTHDQGEAMSLSDRMAVFNEGVVQQCDSALEVYRSPATVFVGRFIGSPPMNLMEAVPGGESPFTLDCDGLRLVPPHHEGSPVPAAQRFLVGVRPDDITVERSAEPGSPPGARASLVEPAGPFDWVDVAWGTTTVKGKAAVESHLRPGDRVGLKIRDDGIVLFDGSTGKRAGTEGSGNLPGRPQ